MYASTVLALRANSKQTAALWVSHVCLEASVRVASANAPAVADDEARQPPLLAAVHFVEEDVDAMEQVRQGRDASDTRSLGRAWVAVVRVRLHVVVVVVVAVAPALGRGRLNQVAVCYGIATRR